jgi:hypothetical protein
VEISSRTSGRALTVRLVSLCLTAISPCHLLPALPKIVPAAEPKTDIYKETTMTRHSPFAIASVAFVMSLATASARPLASPQVPTPSGAAAAAAKESPELIGALSKELGATPEQSAGAAGALFGMVKSRLKPEEFSQIAKVVPGMASLLQAAPEASTTGAAGVLSQLGGATGGLANVASAFSKLGLSPELIAKAVPVLEQFVSKAGGANLGSLLGGVFK